MDPRRGVVVDGHLTRPEVEADSEEFLPLDEGMLRQLEDMGFRRAVVLRGRRTHRLAVTACDRNGNCGLKRLGRFSPR
jgi:hypothetical protein